MGNGDATGRHPVAFAKPYWQGHRTNLPEGDLHARAIIAGSPQSKTTLSRQRKTLRLAFVLLAAPIAGCAAFQAGDAPSKWPPTIDPIQRRPSINVEIKGVARDLFAHWQPRATSAFRDSGVFSEVKSNPDATTDFIAEIQIKHTISGTWSNAGMRFLCGFTFFLVPTTASDNFEVQVNFLDSHRQQIGHYGKQGSATLWVQAFMLPFAPFKTAPKALEGVCYDISAAAISDAMKDGVFHSKLP